MTERRALFLDNDVVINAHCGCVCTPERTDLIDGIFQPCRVSTGYGFLNVVVTNQVGIAHRYYAKRLFLDYVDWVRGGFRKQETQLDAMHYRPHHPEYGIGEYRHDCECRRPKPGMIFAERRDLELADSIPLGDGPSNLEADQAAGVGACVAARVIRGFAAMPRWILRQSVTQCGS